MRMYADLMRQRDFNSISARKETFQSCWNNSVQTLSTTTVNMLTQDLKQPFTSIYFC